MVNDEEEGGEFDDLVSALRSGEVFESLSKQSPRKQRRHKGVDDGRERPAQKLDQYRDRPLTWTGTGTVGDLQQLSGSETAEKPNLTR